MTDYGAGMTDTAEVPAVPTLLISGLDSLYVSYYLDTATGLLDWEDLAYRKERVGRDRNAKFEKLTLGTETFALQAFGRHPYKYVLANKEFEVRLGERMSPSCHVQYFSEALWHWGVDALTARFARWCDSVGLIPTRPEVMSRADFAFDYHLPVVDFVTEDFVSRAAKDGQWRQHGDYQTFQFGQGMVVVRVYDKVAEIEQQSEKAWFFDLWGRKDGVWRVEFQIRNERLKEGGIKTVKDLKELQGDVLRELAGKHTTLRRPNGDSNRSRWPLHPLWQALQTDIEALPQTGLVQALDQKALLDFRLYRMGKSLLGHMKGLATLLYLRDGGEVPSLDDTLKAFPGVLLPHFNAQLWQADLARRLDAEELGQ